MNEEQGPVIARSPSLPVDLTVVVGWTVLAGVVLAFPNLRETPLRIVMGIPLLVFLPGYTLVSAVFPERSAALSSPSTGLTDTGLDGIERVGLSIVLSVAITAFVGLSLELTPWEIRLIPVLVGLTGVIGVLSAVAAVRRRALPPDERFSLSPLQSLAARGAAIFAVDSRLDVLLNLIFLASLVLAASGGLYAFTSPDDASTFTEFYLLHRTDDGTLEANAYPTEFVQGEAQTIVIGIENNGHERREYIVVVELQRVDSRQGPTVVEVEEVDRIRIPVSAGGVEQRDYRISPTITGNDLRLAFLLYRDTPPSDPSLSNAYLETHVWINVTPAESTG